MNQLLIATNNQGKVKELHELLTGMDVELVTPAQIGLDLDVVEDGQTYAENAAKKAIAFANASGLISVADDSGLEVDALDGAPGLYSARYGSPDGGKLSDGERRKYLISKLRGLPRPWTARFHATIAIAIPANVTLSESRAERRSERSERETKTEVEAGERTVLDIQIFEGTCEGEIIPEERGSGGFGYDPIFLFPEFGMTMAELSMDEKNRISHRARAVINARGFLEALLIGR